MVDNRLDRIISESIDRLLSEACSDNFSLEVLDSIKTYKGRIAYCDKELGGVQGSGSSRAIYQMDDEKVLKLAINKKGIAQNEVEGAFDYYKDGLGIFPHVYECSDDFTWLVTEFVLPAKEQDFIHCFGIDFNGFRNFIYTLGVWHRDSPEGYGEELSKEKMEKLLENPYLSAFEDYIGGYTNMELRDLLVLGNYGMALRDGEPTIVILDSGLSKNVWKKYYRI